MKRLVALFCLFSFPAFAGQISPPPPATAPLCSGGQVVVGYSTAGTALVCGAAVGGGSIASGPAGQIGIYGGATSIAALPNLSDSVLTITGAGSPAFSTSLPAGLTIPGYAALAGPVFTGDARAVTPATADNDTSIATTAFVKAQGYILGTTAIATTAPLAGGGDLSANRTLSIAGPANLTTFPADLLPKGAGASPLAFSSIRDAGAGVLIGTPPGGSQGAGTLNASGLYVNGVAVGTGTGLISGLAAGNIPIANSPTSLGSSVEFGQTGANRLVQTGPSGKIDFSIIPDTVVSPGTYNNATITVGSDGRISFAGNGLAGGLSGLTSGNIPVANSATTANTSIPFSIAAPSALVLTDATGKISPFIIPSTLPALSACTNCNLNIGIDGRITSVGNGPAAGISTLIGDVITATGSGMQSATVAGLQGRPMSAALPGNQDVLAWNQTTGRWEPFPTPLNSINALIGDGTAGPGSGTQTLTLKQVNPTGVGTFAIATYNDKGLATATANMTGDVTTNGGVATLSTSGVTAGSYTVGTSCLTVDAKGRLTSITPIACGAVIAALGSGTGLALGTGTGLALGVQ